MPGYLKPVAATAPAYQGEGQNGAVAQNRVTFLAAELTLNAVYPMVRLPRGAIIHDIVMTVSDMDGATSGIVSLGVAGDAERYIRRVSIQAAGTFRMGNDATAAAAIIAAPRALPNEVTLDLLIQTAPGTAAPGTVDIAVHYTCE
jgi:hypothetical protein